MGLSKEEPDVPSIPAARFQTTRWSRILLARDRTNPQAKEALSALCETYWYPLYAYIRRKGYGAHESEDLTQGFFCRFLQKNYLKLVKREKGRFRCYLLGALSHFLANERDRAQAEKRGGGTVLLQVNFHDAEERYRLEPAHEMAAGKLFDRRWVLTLLDQVLKRLEEEYTSAGKAKLFRSLSTILLGDDSTYGEYTKLAAELEMTQGAVKTAAHRMRRRFRELLREEIAQTVARPEEIDEEIRHLFEVLGR